VEEVIEEPAELVERVAALDIGKATLVACARVPQESKRGRRRQEVRTFATTTRSLLELADWLHGLGVTLVVMESTSTYWKPPFYLLEESCACWLVNAREVKNVPGRPKTDKQDAVWLAKLAERGMLRPSFVPPPWQRSCGTLPATGAPSSTSGPGRSSAPRSCWKTPRSNCRQWSATCSGCRVGRCWRR
jgi:transposase